MKDQHFFRTVLLLGSAFNLFGALVFLFPDTIGAFAHLPPAGSIFYSWLLAMFVGLFGLVYGWLAFQPRISRSLIGLSAIGKVCVFGISLCCWLLGAISTAGLGPSIIDLLFSFVFFWWLSRNR